GTGVAFTRDPATGENVFYGEFLMNAQGEDVVAGVRTPLPIAPLERENPKAYAQLGKIRRTLERHYRDVMDIEFTIQQGTLYMLQCRVGKRTALAAVRIALDMVRERLITRDEALRRVEPDGLEQLLRPTFDAKAKDAAVAAGRLLARGLAAGPGAAAGRIAFHADEAEARAARGESVILVRIETSPEDLRGMAASRGILTARGGMTSHAALAFGAEGIGLCRTEHMLFGEGKLGPMREMILAETVEERRAALSKLLPFQRTDFEGIFEVMQGRPVTIRTIDPPLHEFLPHD